MKVKAMSYFLFTFTSVASFLFFTIQLASSKIITPIFGGIAWVWILTMLFYQGVLLAGYFFAGRLRNKPTKTVLLVLGLFMALSTLLVKSPDQWGANLETYGMVQVIYILLVSVGLPGLVLSASTIILQKAAHSADITPWQLYFYSNIGSLSAIFLYPFVIENMFPISIFIKVWVALLLILGITIAVISRIISKDYIYSPHAADGTAEKAKKRNKIQKPTKKQKVMWLIFSAVPSAFLAVISAFLTEDITAMPFLWALPLGVFMLAFSLPFAPKSIIAVNKNFHYFLSSIVVISLMYYYTIIMKPIALVIVLSLTAVFYVTWVYVSGLVKNKPAAEYLQDFYVSIAVGGFLGNFIVSVISPIIFDTYIERWIITLLVIFVPAVLVLFKDKEVWLFKKNSSFKTQIVIIIVIILLGVIQNQTKTYESGSAVRKRISAVRSMYGNVVVEDQFYKESHYRYLFNGNTMHGFQAFIDGKQVYNIIPDYYGLETPLPYFMERLKQKILKEGTQNVAVIGLGAGVQNVFNYKGIKMTFFEIDKNVEMMARKYFTYLDIPETDYSVEIGDGRILIDKNPDNKYAVIVVDAFSGDSIPRHLVTKEAIKLYSEKLTEDGILMMHTTNRYLKVDEIANLSIYKNNLYCYTQTNKNSTWVIASKKPIELTNKVSGKIFEYPKVISLENKTWTDDYTPLLPFMY